MLELISNIFCATGIASFFLGLNYGFWVCGDYPDTICTGLLLAGIVLGGFGTLIGPREKQNSRSGEEEARRAA